MRKLLLVVVLCCLFLAGVGGNARAFQAGPPPTVGYMKIFREINDAKGKVILVNFFATWCGPCMLEIPGLMALRKLYPEQEIVMIGVSMDTDYGQLRAYLQKTPVNYTVYHADQQVGQIFQVTSLPKMLVYDRKGTLAVNHDGFLPPEQLKQVLDGLFGEQKANNAGQEPAPSQQAAAAQGEQ